MKKIILSAAIALVAFTACQNNSNTDQENETDSLAYDAITEEGFANYIETLSSDAFMGRKPFTKGDTLTVNYIKNEFENLGLKPGNGESYFQEVPLVEITSKPVESTLSFQGKEGSIDAEFLDDYVVGSRQLQEELDFPSTELVFVGFGIVAPEYDWNDYEDLDVTGKTVVALVSDPGKYDKDLFKADTMTYYGRWKYKYEEAARQGATGVLLIHETEAASYGWDVVRNGWSGPQLDMVTSDKGSSYAGFEGWVTNDLAKSLFELGDVDFEATIKEAKKPGFKAVPLNVKTSIKLQGSFRESTSNNVLGLIEGESRPDEYVIYTAHWDHLGIGTPIEGDSIFNGAIDNAAGVSALFEIAKAFNASTKKPERSVLFIALTAEEEGLLGSLYYTNNPIYPLENTVANINMDAFNPIGATKDVTVMGIGQTELEDYLVQSADKFDREVRGDKNISAGLFYRSDHFNFVKKGVPGLFMGSGSDYLHLKGDELKAKKEAFENRYHNVTDEFDEHWSLDGIVLDTQLFFDLGFTLSNERTFPEFKEGSEFFELGKQRLNKRK